MPIKKRWYTGITIINIQQQLCSSARQKSSINITFILLVLDIWKIPYTHLSTDGSRHSHYFSRTIDFHNSIYIHQWPKMTASIRETKNFSVWHQTPVQYQALKRLQCIISLLAASIHCSIQSTKFFYYYLQVPQQSCLYTAEGDFISLFTSEGGME